MGLENGANQKNTEMIGVCFGRLTVIAKVPNAGRSRFLCKCSCGNEKTVRMDHLKRGIVLSCGCYQSEKQSQATRTHGMSKTRIYRIWKDMRRRCDSPCVSEYPLYGGRGISVCEEWQKFELFYEWAMASGYRDDLSIDRKNNDGNYEPTNCKWSTQKEQALNRSTNAMLTYDGITKHISEWDRDIGATKSGRVRARLNAGWSVADAVTIRVGDKRRKI